MQDSPRSSRRSRDVVEVNEFVNLGTTKPPGQGPRRGSQSPGMTKRGIRCPADASHAWPRPALRRAASSQAALARRYPPTCYFRTVPERRIYVTDAIVLSRFELGEADRVLTLITPEYGKLKAIAKGVRRQKSRLGGSLEPFAELRVQLARGRTFDVVTQVSVGHAWLRLRDSLGSAATAWYIAELADRSVEERDAAESLYALLRRAYELLDRGMAPDRVARWYEMRLAEELGVRPELERCVECDHTLEPDDRF